MKSFISPNSDGFIVSTQSKREPLFQEYEKGTAEPVEEERVKPSTVIFDPIIAIRWLKIWLIVAFAIMVFEIIFISRGLANAFGEYPYNGLPGYNPPEYAGSRIVIWSFIFLIVKLVFGVQLRVTPASYFEELPSEIPRKRDKYIGRTSGYTEVIVGFIIGTIFFVIGVMIDLSNHIIRYL